MKFKDEESYATNDLTRLVSSNSIFSLDECP